MRARGKYGAVPTMVDGIRFASKAEAHRYQELRLLVTAGHIRGLKLQPRYKLWAAVLNAADEPTDVSETVCVYVADFCYEEKQGKAWILIVEDVKGVETPIFKLKAKFFAACYGREVRITR